MTKNQQQEHDDSRQKAVFAKHREGGDDIDNITFLILAFITNYFT